MRILIWFTLVTLFYRQGFAQIFLPKNYPKDAFSYPLNIPVKLNANFGELRKNHFHMGLDLYTLSKENLPVYATADGWISKIKIDPRGFGNATYITHYNGFSTLYCHMNSFPPTVLAAIKEGQYKKEKWNGDVVFEKERFPVKKGDFIGYSGNTGASGGPHVHYEIRRTEDDVCINPLLMHQLYDVTSPDIFRIAVYDRHKSSYEQQPKILKVIHDSGGFTISSGFLSVASNKIGIALQASDRMTGVQNPNGIYEAVIYLNEQPVSGFQIDGIDYLQTRYMNAHVDYRLKQTGGAYWQHLTPLPGDRLPIYYKANPSGCIELTDTAKHSLRIEVKDANGNAANMRFQLQWNGEKSVSMSLKDSRYMMPGLINVFEKEAFQMVSTEKSFYDAFKMTYSVKPGNMKMVSDIHIAHSPVIPVHDSIYFRIKPTRSLSEQERARVIMIQSALGKLSVSKALEQRGWYAARFRSFGEYRLEVDLVPPQITVKGVVDGGILKEGEVIVCTLNEDYKEIRLFRAELDGKWLMFEGMGPVFRYKTDEYCQPGEHQLRFIAEDEAGNRTEKKINFTRL
ncbi:MAG: M23 family metallopeptidase [Bacteroidetes bacterium]|nr:M23 family metallopeptidase [Bacteroidota bacterium]